MVYAVNNIKFCLFLVNIAIILCFIANIAYAHIPQNNKTIAPIQEWKNAQENVKIQFSYIPEKPLAYTETDLIFSMQDLTTGNHIKDLIAASITITKNDKIFFKFNDVAIHNGDLALKVRFTEEGSYQVINQISSTDNIAIALASFDIYVPLQPAGKLDVDSLFSSLIPAGLVAIGLSAIIVVLVLVLRKRGKSE